MGAKNLFFSGLKDVGSGMVETVCSIPAQNHRGIGSGIGKILVGTVSAAAGLTVGAVKLGAKAVNAGRETAEKNRQQEE